MKTVKERFCQGKERRPNKVYEHYSRKIRRLRKKYDTLKGKEGRTRTTSGSPTSHQRSATAASGTTQAGTHLTRNSADSTTAASRTILIIGVIGSHADAEAVREEVKRVYPGDTETHHRRGEITHPPEPRRSDICRILDQELLGASSRKGKSRRPTYYPKIGVRTNTTPHSHPANSRNSVVTGDTGTTQSPKRPTKQISRCSATPKLCLPTTRN